MTPSTPVPDTHAASRHVSLPTPWVILGGFALAFLAVVLIGVFSLQSLQIRTRSAERVTQTLQVMEQLQALLSALKDAESSQRGFLLTGTESYLEHYNTATGAIGHQVKSLRGLTADNPHQQERLAELEPLTSDKLAELAETIALRRAHQVNEALAVVQSDRGRATMDHIRRLVIEMQTEERSLLGQRQREWQRAAWVSDMVIWSGSAVLIFLIALSAWLTTRDFRLRETEAWLRTTQLGLSTQLQGGPRLDQLGYKALSYLAERLGAYVGAVYVNEFGSHFKRVAGYALPPGTPEVLLPGDSLPGQAAKEDRLIVVRDLPASYWPISSGVGSSAPRELLVVPVSVEGVVQAVVELGFFRAVTPLDEQALKRTADVFGLAIRSAKDRTQLQRLIEEMQVQTEELQAQQEASHATNEELEEQSRVLKESQAQLETQQVELEQINADLELQTRLLKAQKTSLSQAQTALQKKSDELERSNQVKSEFLANMSHELRTPLNSSLILSKLLADNRPGNLTEEQVKFAQTIYGAGHDLLTLINDILDLSKIEAGKMEVSIEPVRVARSVDALVRSFEPLAQQKGLALSAAVEPGTPEFIETDGKRLAQILRNLLGNALKFTAHGKISVRVYADSDATLSFAVRDTGIGIAPEQQTMVFEAFRQAEGGIHRQYGGTGLGLSISRDLARLLGGDITLQSQLGEGSVFTLTMPRSRAVSQQAAGTAHFAEDAVPAHLAPSAARSPRPARPPDGAAVPLSAVQLSDDREQLAGAARSILVIEDDQRFAAILRDLVREKGFRCIVTHRASEGLDAAITWRPNAIVLDMNLPDLSGLGVLDQLKSNPQTRHIPVHIVSVADYSRVALERGAVGYALKPVQREQLMAALETLEAKFSQSLRRVLVVEDDARQMQSIKELLAGDEVEITGVASASEALQQLETTTFDCVVLDLNLPDVSGYQLLESMARRDDISFPPVIVYTGRSLSRDEEQELRRYSHSIIIKDARSPERLLGEVTLFLHQVEAKLPADRQRMLNNARARDAMLEGRRILVVEDDVRNIFALSSVFESQGAHIAIARNGLEALQALERSAQGQDPAIDLVLMDIMMPEMDGLTAMREIRKDPQWRKLPIIALTAKAMRDDQEKCFAAGANDYIAKPLDVGKLLSLVRVWMPK